MFIHYDPQEPSRSVVFHGRVENGTVIGIVVFSAFSLFCFLWPIKFFGVYGSNKAKGRRPRRVRSASDA